MHVQGCSKLLRCSCSLRLTRLESRSRASKLSTIRSKRCCPIHAYRVDIDFNGRTETLEVEEGQTILEVALEQGLELSHDCKMGVCMTCPAKMVTDMRIHSSVQCCGQNATRYDCNRFLAELISQQACWTRTCKRKDMH